MTELQLAIKKPQCVLSLAESIENQIVQLAVGLIRPLLLHWLSDLSDFIDRNCLLDFWLIHASDGLHCYNRYLFKSLPNCTRGMFFQNGCCLKSYFFSYCLTHLWTFASGCKSLIHCLASCLHIDFADFQKIHKNQLFSLVKAKYRTVSHCFVLQPLTPTKW